MSPDVISVRPTDTMTEVRKLLLDNRISGLPVVEHEKLTGIISLDNFITCIMYGRMNETVSDHMTVEVVSFYPDEPLIHAINKFEKLGYGRFPVLDRNTKKLVGIITKGDIIKCLLKKLETNYHEEEIHKYRASHIFEDINSDQTRLILRHNITGGNHKHAGEQSGYLKTNLLRLGIPPQIVRRIVIASCEAEMNIIIFTEGGEIAACVEEDKITVNAIDHGPGIPDIEKALQPGFSTAPDWVRDMGFGAGMGLPNIKNCSDEMRIDSKPGEGTNVEFVVFLRK
jgi:anti-sigma regulatory factor (Ser/Thr protein kinase)/predicted transcriptional regulator